MDCEDYVMSESVTFIIPYEIIYHILTFVIITNKDACDFLMICPRWKICIDHIFANLNPTWDFKRYRVSPLDFPIYNAIWDDTLYELIKRINDYGKEIVNDPKVSNKRVNPKVDLILPNILEIYDSVEDYKFKFHLKCPCTIWNHNATVKLRNGYTHKSGPIIQTSFSLNNIENKKFATSLDSSDISIYLEIHCKLNPNEFIFDQNYMEHTDLNLSMETIFELDKKMESPFNEDSYNFLSIGILDGMFILCISNVVNELIPLWSSKNLSFDELSKIQNRRTWKEKERYHYVRICVIKTWINHLKCIQPFDFISLKSIIPLNGRFGKSIYSSVVKDGMSMCFQF